MLFFNIKSYRNRKRWSSQRWSLSWERVRVEEARGAEYKVNVVQYKVYCIVYCNYSMLHTVLTYSILYCTWSSQRWSLSWERVPVEEARGAECALSAGCVCHCVGAALCETVTLVGLTYTLDYWWGFMDEPGLSCCVFLCVWRASLQQHCIAVILINPYIYQSVPLLWTRR